MNESNYLKYGQHADILPTTLHLLGVKEGGDFDGLNLFVKNRSVVNFCFYTTYGVLKDDFKYIRHISGREELYYLANDSSETNNLVDKIPIQLSEMRENYQIFKKNS